MTHDLHDFMTQLSAKLDAEYCRIRKSASKDPGTAGDEREENWAQLIRDWLPPAYHVATKGQLLDESGVLSPQVDVLVLKPSYPLSLHTKKKYLAAGVAAVFECKLTLKKEHISQAIAAASKIKRMARSREGSPYRELVVEPIFGLLAHSHSWSRARSGELATSTIEAILEDSDCQYVNHPREMADLLCVSDLATWSASKHPLSNPKDEIDPDSRSRLNPKGTPATSYMCHARNAGLLGRNTPNFSPIGVFLTELLVKLAWEDPSLRDIASYFLGVEFSTSSTGTTRYWPVDIYSRRLRKKLTLNRLEAEIDWNEWAVSIE